MIQLLKDLNEVLAADDAAMLEKQKTWALGRKQALAEFDASDEGKAARKDAWAYYPKAFRLCGGKGWYGVVKGPDDFIVDFVEKNIAATIEKRNHKIAAKLAPLGAKEIVSKEYVRIAGGIDGTFILSTNTGRAGINISTIYAGGYNVQCLHMRCLVKTALLQGEG